MRVATALCAPICGPLPPQHGAAVARRTLPARSHSDCLRFRRFSHSSDLLSDDGPLGATRLPRNAFVWCCFNNSYKFNPPLFDIWCRLLAAVHDSVLWVIPGAKETEKNLLLEAAARHIDPARKRREGSFERSE